MTELPQEFVVLKQTGTHADAFTAAGLADLLSSIPNVNPVNIEETPAAFVIHLPRKLTPGDIGKIPQIPGYPFLKANENVKVPSAIQDAVDYQAEKRKAARIKKIKEDARKNGPGLDSPEVKQALQMEQQRADWHLLQVLNTLQGHKTSNKVYETIATRKPEQFVEEMKQAIRSLAHQTNSGLDWKTSTVQLFSPNAAKGYSRLKPDSTGRNDKTKDQWADPFIEWLRYRGYYKIACPYFQGKKAENIRMLTPIPHNITITALESIVREFRKTSVYGGPPKLDALAVLSLAEELIKHSEEYHDPDIEIFPGLYLQNETPASAIAGMAVTHYQSMGNAKAVSAMSVLAVPGWFPIQNRQDAKKWLEILDEHKRVIRGLQDDRSDEIGLLISYRKFLEKRGEGAVSALLEFMEHYGPFLLRAREQGRKLKSFETENVRRIIMSLSPGLGEILDNQGFQAVATAVRKATVNAQAQKAMNVPDHREIRYELLHDLRRKRNLPGKEPFIETISDFIAKYNYENARRREMNKTAARNVTTEEFEAFVALVDKFGASIVGALLGAYGSCRESSEEPEGEGSSKKLETEVSTEA